MPAAAQTNAPRPRRKTGGGAGAAGREAGGLLAACSKPPLPLLPAARPGARGGGGRVRPEEPTATDSKQWNGGSLPEGAPAADCYARHGTRGHRGGAAEPRRGRAGFCAQPPPPAALAGAAGAVKAQSRRMHGAPLRSRRDGLRAYRRSADAMSGSTTSGNGGQRPHGGREQHAPQLRGELPSRRAKWWPYL